MTALHPVIDFDLERAAGDFARAGFLVLPDFLSGEALDGVQQAAARALAAREPPLELEADVGYPGAPPEPWAPGGDTPRRLLRAWDRDPAFRQWLGSPLLRDLLSRLLGSRQITLVRAHHNCLMTKHPRWSSDTGWHQDVRYWQFSDRELINAWLALTPERMENGALRVIPGSHRMEIAPERLDEERFLRPECPTNRPLMDVARTIELAPGDLLLFHAALFHAASRNHTDQVKLSLVYTCHGPKTRPLTDTRSSSIPEVDL